MKKTIIFFMIIIFSISCGQLKFVEKFNENKNLPNFTILVKEYNKNSYEINLIDGSIVKIFESDVEQLYNPKYLRFNFDIEKLKKYAERDSLVIITSPNNNVIVYNMKSYYYPYKNNQLLTYNGSKGKFLIEDVITKETKEINGGNNYYSSFEPEIKKEEIEKLCLLKKEEELLNFKYLGNDWFATMWMYKENSEGEVFLRLINTRTKEDVLLAYGTYWKLEERFDVIPNE